LGANKLYYSISLAIEAWIQAVYLVSFHMEACKQAKQSVRIHIHKRSHIVVGTQESKVSTFETTMRACVRRKERRNLRFFF